MIIAGRIKRKLFPYAGLLSASDYRRVLHHRRFQPGTVAVQGEPTRFSDPHGLLHSLREIYQEEVYRFQPRSERPVIIDAGANIGLSVRYFKQRYPNSTVLAFEPDAEIFQLLRSNCGHLPGVELRETAAWVEDTKLTFYREGSLAGSSEVDYASTGRAITVNAERLKPFLQRPIDFLKIDIEGAENAVLFDIADELDNVHQLFFEYHAAPGKPQRLGDMLSLVAGKGFRYIINGTHGPAHPFVERSQSAFELQLNVSCYRP